MVHYSQGVHLFRKFRINIFSQVLCITSYRVYLLRNFHIKSHSTCLVHFPNTKYIYYEIFQLNQLEVYVLYMIFQVCLFILKFSWQSCQPSPVHYTLKVLCIVPSVCVFTMKKSQQIPSHKACPLYLVCSLYIYIEKIAINPITQVLCIIPSMYYLVWKIRNIYCTP